MSDKKDRNQEEEKEIIVVPKRFHRRMGDQPGSATSTWLVSFTDVMALMLTFFVLLFAMSNPAQEDWLNLRDNMQKNFNKIEGKPLKRGAEDTINIQKINFSKALNLNYLRALIENLVKRNPELANVELIDAGSSLIISLPQEILFESGNAEVRGMANRALYTLAGSLRRIKNRIEIVGHTDPRPTSSTSDFTSNWSLSLKRAATVAAVLEGVGYDQPIIIRGQSSGRYQDLDETIPEDTRLELSRRVDIVVMEDDGRQPKLFDLGMPNTN